MSNNHLKTSIAMQEQSSPLIEEASLCNRQRPQQKTTTINLALDYFPVQEDETQLLKTP